MPSHRSSRASSRLTTIAPVVILVLLLAIVATLAVVVWHLVTGRKVGFIPPAEQCLATINGQTASLDLEQSHYASVIVGEALARGLEPRAASIALATAMQESNLHNLGAGEGDRDSVGLFQQRPSMGWGSSTQLNDPWYASGRFYAALVKVPDWRTGNINDVAQEVQKSGVPDGYTKHVDAARTIASSATGFSALSMSCSNRETTPGHAADLAGFMRRAFPSARVSVEGKRVVVSGLKDTAQWAAAHLAMMNTGADGVNQVSVAARSWTNDTGRMADWKPASPSQDVVITVR